MRPNQTQFSVALKHRARRIPRPRQDLAALLFVFWRPLIVVLAMLGINSSVLAGGLPLPAPVTRDEPAGQLLAQQIRSSLPVEDSEIHGTLVIKSDKIKTEIPVVCQVKLQGGTWETTYQTAGTVAAPAERLVIIHSINGPNQYLYARAPKPGAPLSDAVPVPPAATDVPFAGSDFSLGELGLEFLHWPGQSKLPGQLRLGQECYVLESTTSGTSGIVRVISWIDKKTLGPLVAEAYDSAGNKIKEFSLDSKSFKKDARGRWQLKEMGIDNLKSGSHTDLKFDTPKD